MNNLCSYCGLVDAKIVKFRYSERAAKVGAIFHHLFEISSVKLEVEDGPNFHGLLRISEHYFKLNSNLYPLEMVLRIEI